MQTMYVRVCVYDVAYNASKRLLVASENEYLNLEGTHT